MDDREFITTPHRNHRGKRKKNLHIFHIPFGKGIGNNISYMVNSL